MKKLLFGITVCVLVCAMVQGAEANPKKNKKRWSFSRKKKAAKVLQAQSKAVQQPPKGLEYVAREEFDLLQKQFLELQQQREEADQNVVKASIAMKGLQRMIDGLRGEVKSSLESIVSESTSGAQQEAARLVALEARVQVVEAKQEKLEMRVQDGFVVVTTGPGSDILGDEGKNSDLEGSVNE